ncbi:hypothetical protein BDV59DRAFT_173242 [Aspergillus ambiguus]|uniref:uncharacterized protein n=1 Tax=Aspergillus ambiguus TaxID=176160 RepID=UPI003CCD4D1D
MDLQGNPLPHGQRSTKVTNDPEASRNPIFESAGPVAGDSLAAESSMTGGGFSENRGAQPLGVTAGQSTLNTTDTSGATKLPSASVGTQRENIHRQEKYPDALGGQGDYPGAHLPESGYTGGPTASKQNIGVGQGGYPASQKLNQGQAAASGSGYQSKYNAGQAPSYVSDVTGDLGSKKPKGKNLTEGGFDDSNNASFNTDIGSKNDPGRYAENTFQRYEAESGPDAGGGPRQKGVDSGHWYQHLQSDQRA